MDPNVFWAGFSNELTKLSAGAFGGPIKRGVIGLLPSAKVKAIAKPPSVYASAAQAGKDRLKADKQAILNKKLNSQEVIMPASSPKPKDKPPVVTAKSPPAKPPLVTKATKETKATGSLWEKAKTYGKWGLVGAGAGAGAAGAYAIGKAQKDKDK